MEVGSCKRGWVGTEGWWWGWGRGVSERSGAWRAGEARAAVSMMGSDSGLSRGSGCPEKCEAGAMRWQERAGCQSKKVALKRQKGKESACQARSAPAQPNPASQPASSRAVAAAAARSGYGAETKGREAAKTEERHDRKLRGTEPTASKPSIRSSC